MSNNFNFNYNLDGSQSASVKNDTDSTVYSEKEKDSRVWSTDLTDDVKTYSADIRILPESNIDPATGMDNLNGYPSKRIMMHRLRMGRARNLVEKCLKKDPKDKRSKICPYCDWAWSRYFLMKNPKPEVIQQFNAQGLNIQEELKANMSNMPYERWVTNVRILSDNVHPENNGQVKIWEHSQKVNDMLDTPKDPCEVEYRVRLRKAHKGEQVEYPDASLFKNTPRFVPEHPIVGHVLTVVCTESDNKIEGQRKPLPTYSKSSFAPLPTRLADTDEEMISILQQRHNLEEYAYGDIPSYEEAKKILDDWLVEASAANTPNGEVNGGTASVATQQNYNNVMKSAPAATAKPMTHIDSNNFAANYKTQQQSQAASAPAYSMPASATAPVNNARPAAQYQAQQSIPQQNSYQYQQPMQTTAPAYSMPASATAAPQQPQSAPQQNVASNGGAMLEDEDDLPF